MLKLNKKLQISYEHKAHEKFKAAGIPIPDSKNLIPFISNDIARIFEVSAQAAEIRLKSALTN